MLEQDLRYPIGGFLPKLALTPEERRVAIAQMAQLPMQLNDAVAGLVPEQLDTPYRPGGWTVRQVTHHLADSHMHGYIRFKMGLTEETPRVKPYFDTRWAELADSRMPVDVSVQLIAALHQRWVRMLESMRAGEFARRINDPESGTLPPLDNLLALYSWHGRHHVAHITSLRQRKGWTEGMAASASSPKS